MKNLVNLFTVSGLRLILSLRYRIRYSGPKLAKKRQKVLILSDWVSELDPLLIHLTTKCLCKINPKSVHTPWLKALYRKWGFFKAEGEVEMLYDAPKRSLFEPLKSLPQLEGDVYLLKIHGMWGSSFSNPSLGFYFKGSRTIRGILKTLFLNGFFFMPMRKVVIECIRLKMKPPQVSDVELALLEPPKKAWSLSPSEKGFYYVPYYFWRQKAPEGVEKLVVREIARLAEKKPHEIKLTDDLFLDVGLTSLDVTELLIFLSEKFHKRAQFEDLRTVDDVVLAASTEGNPLKGSQKFELHEKLWLEGAKREKPFIEEGVSIGVCFLKKCDRLSSKPAAADSAGMMSYSRMKSLALGLAAHFSQIKSEKIGVILPSLSLSNVLILGLIIARKVPVLLNFSLGEKHIQDVVDQAGLKEIITLKPVAEHIGFQYPQALKRLFLFYEDIQEKTEEKTKRKFLNLARQPSIEAIRYFRLESVKKEDTAVILFTSGSEKKPKGVPLSHENLISNQKGALKDLGLQPDEVMMGLLPLFHVFGFSCANLLPLLYGIRVVFFSNPLAVPDILPSIRKWQPTLLLSTPTFITRAFELAKEKDLKSVRTIILGAEKLTQTHLDEIEDKTSADILQGYGITECSPILTLNRRGEKRGVGYPLEGVQLKIVNPETKKEAKKGLILAKGKNVFSGYLASYSDPFFEGWYVTGDLGYFDETGALHLTGRLSRTLKIGGELISLEAVEEAAQSILKKPLAVIDEEGKLILCVEEKVDHHAFNHKMAKSGFPRIYHIAEVRCFDPLPVLPSGKIDYQKIKERY